MRIDYSPTSILSWFDSGFRLMPAQFTYSIPGAESTWPGYASGDEPFGDGFAVPDAGLALAFASAIRGWDELIAPDFAQVLDNSNSRGELRVAFTDITQEDAVAYAYYPVFSGGKPGDVWISSNSTWDWQPGEFGFFAMLHEIGHALGLEHSFGEPSAPADLESRRFTVMSYTPPEDMYVSFAYDGDDFFAYFATLKPTTPMVLDIAAVQAIYGSDPETRAGDTVYTFDQWNPALQAIYDAGGHDTIDLSDHVLASRIDLEPGAYSGIAIADAAAQADYWSERFPEAADFVEFALTEQIADFGFELFEFADNVGIALSTVIEDAIGGSGDDVIHGNAADNSLHGNAGDDELFGKDGADFLSGGSGADVLYGDFETVQASPLTIDQPVETGRVLLLIGPAASNIINAPASLVITAPSGPDALVLTVISGVSVPAPTPVDSGMLAGPGVPIPGVTVLSDPDVNADTLDGGEGDDLLIGGAGRDVMTGGSGSDLFAFDEGDFSGKTYADADRILDFSEAEGDRIDLSAVDAVMGDGEDAFVFVGSRAFSGTAGELRYERIGDDVLVTGDINGSARADFAILLDDVASLSASAFIA